MEIKRDRYLNQLISYMWDGQVKVITGIRRCGKSYLLRNLFKNYLLETGVSENQIIAFEQCTNRTDRKIDQNFSPPSRAPAANSDTRP